jgi:hypothetical protein
MTEGEGNKNEVQIHQETCSTAVYGGLMVRTPPQNQAS